MSQKDETIIEELANVPREGENPFMDKETETPAAPPAEETKKEQEKAEEPKKPETELPFHKHPDWIKREKKLEERFQTLQAQYEEKLKEVESRVTANQPQTVKPIPKWFSDLYGENPDAWREYSNYETDMRKAIKDEALREIRAEQEQKLKEQKEINASIDSSIAELREEGKEFDENELMKIAIEYQPSNEKGEIDLHKAFKLMEALKPQKPSATAAKKEIAAQTVKRTTEAPKRDYATPNDFKGKSWRDLLS